MKPLMAPVDQGDRDLDGPLSGGTPMGEDQCYIKKAEQSIRLIHWNIRGFMSGYNNFYMRKINTLQKHSLESEADVLMWNELNSQWPLLPPEQRLETKTATWWEAHHVSKAFNRRDTSGKKDLHGGCAVIASNRMCYRVVDKGEDASKLGRWAWTTFQGKRGKKLTVCSAYRPCIPSPCSSNAVWHQHNAFFATQDRAYETPREAILSDLFAELHRFHAKGHLLIAALDLNESVHSSPINTRFRALGMKLAHKLPQDFNTHVDGSFPIDGMWVSTSLNILQSGTGPFDLSTSDHRPLWLDVSISSALGDPLPPLASPRARRLKLRDPRIVKKYNHIFDKELGKTDVLKRIESFDCSLPLSQKSEHDLECIDALVMSAMAKADKGCRKFKTGQLDWSPVFQAAKEVLIAWQMVYRRQVLRKKINLRTLSRQCKKAKIDLNVCSISKEEIQDKLAAARTQYRAAAKEASTSRLSFYEDLAQARAAAGNGKAETQLRLLLQREELRKTSRVIGSILGTKKGAQLSMVEVEEEGSVRLTNDKEEIERACIRTNIQRVQDSNDTPLRTEPLLSLFGNYGETEAGEKVLNGSLVLPPGTPTSAAETLPYFKEPQGLASLSAKDPFTVEEWCRGWKKMKETTGTRSSFPHFGHFKAPHQSTLGAKVLSSLARIAFFSGHSFKRWQHGTDIMIPKKAKSLRPDKLRLIQLYEPDFNHQNKLIGKIAMCNGEKVKALAPEQFGSRKGHRAVDQALNKVLLLDTLRYEQRSAILCANDAKSCYDRVSHVAAYLALRRLGVPKAALGAMFTTLQRMTHNIRTAHGDSTLTYGGEDWERPPCGYGQGNGTAPSGYAALTSPLLDRMRQEGYTFDLRSPISNNVISLAGFAFVDDTDTGTAAKNGESLNSLMTRAQELILKWGEALSVTGGALEPSKSDVTVVNFVEHERLPKYCVAPHSLQMRAPDGQLEDLRDIGPSEGRMTLGVMIAADGSQTDQLQHMTQKSESWADRVRAGHLPRHISWHALQTTILKTLAYPLAATCLSEVQCTNALSPALTRGLASSGIVRNINRDIVHAPRHLQGFGIPSLYDLQGYEHIKRLLDDGPSNTITGKLIRMNIELTKIETGLGGNLFDIDFSKVAGWIPNSWVGNTWEFLSRANIKLIEGTPRLPLLGDGDCFIMERILQLEYFSPSELLSINYCRKFLGVVSLAEISTADGAAIRPNCYHHVDRHVPHRLVKWKRPTDPPKLADWSLWRQAIRMAFCSSLDAAPSRLRSPLGAWNLDFSHWLWFYSPSVRQIFKRCDNIFQIYNSTGRNLRSSTMSFQIDVSTTMTSLPVDVQLATVEMNFGSLIISGSTVQRTSLPSFTFPHSHSLTTAIHNLPPSQQWIFANCALPQDNGVALVKSIVEGTTCIGVSDGSFKAPLSTASFILAAPEIPRHLHLVGSVPTPGGQSSYRSELVGIFALIICVNTICIAHQIPKGSVQVSCDNDEALRWIFGSSTVSCETSDFDIIRAARTVLSDLPLRCHPTKVKGHRDENVPFDDLSFLEQQNVLVDNLANAFRNNLLRQGYSPTRRQVSADGCWSLSLGPETITSAFRSKVLHHRSSHRRRLQLQKAGLPSTAFDLIDWEAIGKALASLPISRQHWLLKYVSGRSAVGVEMRRRKVWQVDSCPRCSCTETTSHVPLCTAESASKIWLDFITQLPSWFTSHNTDPSLSRLMILILHHWHDRAPISADTLSPFSEELRSLFSAQQAIGCDQVILGRCAVGWSSLQQLYADNNQIRRTGKQWLAAFIRHIWTYLRAQWDDRNSSLHNSNIAHANQGLANLKSQALAELAKGTETMMTLEEKSLWNCTSEQLSDRSPILLRSWLEKAKAARYLSQYRAQNGPYNRERALLAAWLE